jgi:hypothetical protein
MTARGAWRSLCGRRVLAVAAALVAVPVAIAAAAPSYGDWSAPVLLGPPISTAAGEGGPALSDDGLTLYFHSTRPGGLGAEDIYASRRPSLDAPWGTPVNLGPTINTASADNVAALSPDGHWLFFASNRPGGFGGTDIYGSWRPDPDDDLGWQAPANLGPNVNTPLAESGPSYYLNEGGRPQLFYSSSRPGGFGSGDLYVSDLQDDASWGPAIRIPELSSVFNESRPSVRRDGLEVFFHRAVAVTAGAQTDLWSSTRSALDAPWSPPVDLGPVVNTSVLEGTPYVSADGRSLFFVSPRSSGIAGSGDLYMTTRAAKLTVSADDQTRLFGQANPSLTYALSGFVGGETEAVASGSASCATTATASSPAGDYAITCTSGTLSAPGYAFDTFVAGTLTVSHSSACLNGPRAGQLHVAAGEAVCIGTGGSHTGPVTVAPGGSLDVEGGSITGTVVASAAAVVRICGARITGPLTITGSTGLVLIGGAGCDPNTIVGPVRIIENRGGVEFNGNKVMGPLRIAGNSIGAVHAVENAVTGPVTVQP